MKAVRLHVVVLVLMSVVLLSSAVAMADPLTKYGLKPLGSYDLGGNTVTIISWTSARMETYFQTYPPVAGRIAEAEKLFNCKIAFLQTTDIPATNFNRLMAGESGYDLWHVQNKIGYFDLVTEGAALPVGDILPKAYYENLPSSYQATEEALKYKGKIYGIGDMTWRANFGYQNDLIFVAYNKTMFEKYAIPDLYELYVNGEWTWDKATEIAAKLTMDTDGDGVIDQYGMDDVRGHDLAVSNGASITRVDPSGRVVFTADEDAYIEALTQWKQWWDSGWMPQSRNSTNNLNLFTSGKAGMFFYAPSFSLAANILPKMKDEWGIVPFPKGPSADAYYYPNQALSTTLIPVNAKDPEALVALRAFLWQEEDVTVSDFLAAHVKNQESAQVLLEAQELWNGSASRLYEKQIAEFNTAENQISDEDKSPATAMAEIKPVIQARLDDMFNR